MTVWTVPQTQAGDTATLTGPAQVGAASASPGTAPVAGLREAGRGSAAGVRGREDGVPVSAYAYQPEDDDDTFVDHGSMTAQGESVGVHGGAGGVGVNGKSSAAVGAVTAATVGARSVPALRGQRMGGGVAGADPLSIESYYASLAAARAGTGPQDSAGMGGAGVAQGQRSASSPPSAPSMPTTLTQVGAAVGPASPTAPRPPVDERARHYSARRDVTGAGGWPMPARSPGAAAQVGAAVDRRALAARYPPGSMVSEMQMEKKVVRDMALSPDGKHLFAAIGDDPVCELEVRTGKSGEPQLATVRSYDSTEQVNCMALVRIGGGVSKTTFASVADAPTGRRSKKRSKRRGWVGNNADFSSDNDGDFDDDDSEYGVPTMGGGRRGVVSRSRQGASGAESDVYMLWCGLKRGTIAIIDLQTHSSAGTIMSAHKQTVNKMWYLENGRVWSAGRDKALVVWDPMTRKQIKRRNVAAIVSDLCYVSETEQVWAVADDNYVRLYDAGGNNAMLPRQASARATKNTIQMKSEASLVRYHADMNIVWVGLARSTTLMDPDTCKTLAKLPLVVSAVAFHEKTCIAMARGALVGTEDEVAVILDITTPLTPTLLYRGVRVESVIPSIGIRLFSHLPFGVVAHTSSARTQDHSLGLFVYGEPETGGKLGGASAAVQPQPSQPVLKQRTEVLGIRNVVRSHPAPKPLQHPMQASQLQQLQLSHQPSQTALPASPSKLLAPPQQPPPTLQLQPVPSTQMSVFSSRHPASPGMDSNPSARSPAAASYTRHDAGPTRPSAVAVLSAVNPQSSVAAVASAASDIQASFTQLDKKLDDVRAALSTQARVDRPQADFARLHDEMIGWVLETDVDLPALSAEDRAALDRAYHTPEGRALAMATARLRRWAEAEVAAGGPSRASGQARTSGSAGARLSASFPVSHAASLRGGLVGLPWTGTEGSAAAVPPPSALDTTASFPSPGGAESLAAMLVAERLGHLRQVGALRRHNRRVEERAETLARSVTALSAAVGALAVEVQLAAHAHARALAAADEGPSEDADGLEQCAQTLRQWIDAGASTHGPSDDRHPSLVTAETSTRAVRRATRRLSEGVEDMSAAVRLLTSAAVRAYQPSPFRTMTGRAESSSRGSMDGRSSLAEPADVAAPVPPPRARRSKMRRRSEGGRTHVDAARGCEEAVSLADGGDGAPAGSATNGSLDVDGGALVEGSSSPARTPPEHDRHLADTPAVESREGCAPAAASPSPLQTLVVTSPRTLLEVLKAGVSATKVFLASTQREWSQRVTVYSLFAMGAFREGMAGGGGGGTVTALAADFIQCLAAWDLWFAQQMRIACTKELEMSLTEVLLECRWDEGDCVLTGEVGVGFPGAAPASFVEGVGKGNDVGGPGGAAAGAAGAMGFPPMPLLGSSVRGAAGLSPAADATPAAPSSDGAGGLYLIQGRELSAEREALSGSLVDVSLQLEETVSDMRRSLGEMLSGIPEEVRRNPQARGFASMIHNWEWQQQQQQPPYHDSGAVTAAAMGSARSPAASTGSDGAAGLTRSGNGMPGLSATPAAPLRLYADKLRGTLYWAGVCVDLTAVALDAVQRLLYPTESNTPAAGGPPRALHVREDNFLYIMTRLSEWALLLPREESIGEGIAVVMTWLSHVWACPESLSGAPPLPPSTAVPAAPLPVRTPKGGAGEGRVGAAAGGGGKAAAAVTEPDAATSTLAPTLTTAADAAQGFAKARGIYLLRSYLSIGLSRAQRSQSPEQLVGVLFSSNAMAAAGAGAGAGRGEETRSSVEAMAAVEAAREARRAAEAMGRGEGDGGEAAAASGATPVGSSPTITPTLPSAMALALVPPAAAARVGQRIAEMREAASALRHKAAVLRVFAAHLQARMAWVAEHYEDASGGGVTVPCIEEGPLPAEDAAAAAAGHAHLGSSVAVRITERKDSTGATVAVPSIDLSHFAGC